MGTDVGGLVEKAGERQKHYGYLEYDLAVVGRRLYRAVRTAALRVAVLRDIGLDCDAVVVRSIDLILAVVDTGRQLWSKVPLHFDSSAGSRLVLDFDPEGKQSID